MLPSTGFHLGFNNTLADTTQVSYFTALVTANAGLSLAQFGVY